MVGFGSQNLPLRFLPALADGVDATLLDKPLPCSAPAMLLYPLRNARHPQVLPDKVGVGHPSNPLLQHNLRARPLPRGSTQIALGIWSMNLQPPPLLPRALAD